MIPAAFTYERAGSVEEAIELLGRDEDAKLLAGGHSLIPAMKLRIARPTVLVDIGRLDDLRYVREDGDRIAIGALTRHAALVRDPVLAAGCALIAQATELVGDPQIRHRGTIGGSLAHADPASDLGAVVLALDAELVAHGPDGERTIPATEFFTGPFTNALGPQELLTEIRVPVSRARRVPQVPAIGARTGRPSASPQPRSAAASRSRWRAWAGPRCGRVRSRKRWPAVRRRPTLPLEPPRERSHRAT